MGWNTTIVVYNDALDQIRQDPEFGRKLADAISSRELWHGQRVDVPSGCHANACMVVESHHADQTALVTVGGNLGVVQLTRHGWRHHEQEEQEALLAAWADKLGFRLEKKKEPAPSTRRTAKLQGGSR